MRIQNYNFDDGRACLNNNATPKTSKNTLKLDF